MPSLKPHFTQHGFTLHFILPVIAIIGVATVGGYLISHGHAATPTTYSTINVKTNTKECVDNKNGKGVAYNPVQIYSCVGNNNQKWAVNGTSTTAGEIISFNAGYCLNVYNGGKTIGTAVDVYPCRNSPAQQWTVNKTTGVITNPNSKLCLGYTAPISSTGTLLKLVTCSTTAATDQWTVTVLTTGGSGSGSCGSVAKSTASPSGSSYGNNAMSQWNCALTNRATQPVTWVAWGDSITEGQGSSTVAGRWTNQTLTALRGKYPTSGVTGGFGYIPAFYGTYGPDSQWSTDPVTGGSARLNADSNGIGTGSGLGLRTVNLSSGGSDTFKVTGTSTDIMYNYGSGSFSYKVDSGSATTVSTSGGSGAAGSRRVTFSSAGSHTITVSGVSGTVELEGLMTYNGDESKGLRFYDGADTGATTGNFISQVNNIAAVTASVNPDLVTIELGANDFGKGTATPAQVTSNLQVMVSKIRSDSTGHEPSIVIMLVYPNSEGNWSPYANAIKAVATADPTLGLIDMTSFATAGQSSQYLSSTDDLHPSNAGQTRFAGLVESYLEDE